VKNPYINNLNNLVDTMVPPKGAEFSVGKGMDKGGSDAVEKYPLSNETHHSKFNDFIKGGDLPIDWIDPRTKEPFNPLIQGETRTGKTDFSTERVFGSSGRELNAYDLKEAARNIQTVLNHAAYDDRRPLVVNKNVNPDEQISVIAQYLMDPSGYGFAKAGQELLNPIREVIDYEGWIDKVLAPRPVRRGEVVKYDRDVFVFAWVIGEDGETPESQVGGEHFFPPEFEVTAFPTIEIKNIYQAQYDILARTQDRARQAIEFQKDTAGKNLLNAAATTVNSVVAFTSLTLSVVEQIRQQVERHRLIADKLLINRRELSDLLELAISSPVRFDPVTQRAAIMLGYVGNILGMKVIVSAGTNTFEVVKPGEVFVVTLPEYLGGMPIRVELVSHPAPLFPFGRAVQGWIWYTLLSQIVINSAGVAKGIKI